LQVNTWATHALFKPIHHGIPIVLQATSKIEGGFGDTPSGVVIADNPEDMAQLNKTWKNTGLGTVNTQLCARLFHRMDSTAERLDHHFAAAEKLMDWFALQTDIVKDIICPTRKGSPDFARAQEYFGGKGNGLFSIVFRDTVSLEKVEEFLNNLTLIRQTEGWGSHITLAMRLNRNDRIYTKWPDEVVVRFSAGLENVPDLLRDLNRAATKTFGSRAKMRGIRSMDRQSPPLALVA
jgi:cysteine-S-conjugate beta-lyase